jgi:signal transduction histidine kinase
VTRAPSIRQLLLVVNAVILLVPFGILLLSRLYETHLVQQTEGRLIAESVVIAELWRDRLLVELGRAGEPVRGFLPGGAPDARWAPLEPVLDLTGGASLPPQPEPTRFLLDRSGPAWAAGRALQPMLERAQRMNLSAARVLDAQGCVVATSGGELGACLDELPEVRAALSGRYAAVARRRISDEPLPPLESISRRGTVRVFAALPVLLEGRVVGVVRLSRTSRDLVEGLWAQRRPLLLGLGGCVLLTAAISLFFAWTISRPVRAITSAAQAIARGEPPRGLEPRGFVPDEVHTLGEALATMTAQLTDRATYIAELAANLSHELKTPITGIRGAAELLLEEGAEMSEAQRQRFLHNIDAGAERMERLVRRLLELARIQSAPEAAEVVHLPELLARLAERYAGQVRLDLSGAPAVLGIHPDHLESAVRNLLDNAVRHGQGQPVELSAREEAGRAVIRVRDHGRGISEGNRGRIFERFFTTERDRGGTGLGLAIVRAVAETRGGSVSFETGPAGTLFTLVV